MAAPSRIALVIEDEAIVRQIVERMLEKLGYSVLSAEDGAAGVAQFERSGADITLVFLDMTMPRMGGEATLRALRARRPDVPVILASGHSAEDEKLAFLEEFHGVGFLHKPFGLQALSDTLTQLFADASAP